MTKKNNMLSSVNYTKPVTKLEIMEALEHLYLQRKYQEMSLGRDNCESSNQSKCEDSSGLSYNIPLNCQNNSHSFEKANNEVSNKSSTRSSKIDDLLLKNTSSSKDKPALEKKSVDVCHQRSHNRKMTTLKSNQSQRGRETNVQKKSNHSTRSRRTTNKSKMSAEIKKICKIYKLNTNEMKKKVINANETKGNSKVNELIPQSIFNMYKNECIVTPNIEKEVICMYKKSANQYWVMNVSDTPKYETIQRIVSENCRNLTTFTPKVGDLGLIQFKNKWCRGKIILLTPKPVVFFVDLGNSEEYDNIICKQIPSSIKEIENLAFPIIFDDDVPSKCKTENLTAKILLIKGTKKVVNGISVVKVFKINKESIKAGNDMEANSQEKFYSLKSKEDKSSTSSVKKLSQRKFVFDEITESSSGTICLLPGQESIRLGVVLLPAYEGDQVCVNKLLNEDILNVPSKVSDCQKIINGKKDDIVEVHDSDSLENCGSILNKINDRNCVELKKDRENDDQFSLQNKTILNFGVYIVIKKVVFKNLLLHAKALSFKITGSEEPGKWSCVLKSTHNERLVANAILEKPTESVNENILATFINSKCIVQLSAFNSSNAFYIQKSSEAMAEKISVTNRKIAEFASKVNSLTSPPEIGELCSAKCEKHQCFYRGRVLSQADEKFRILFVDFGFVEDVTLKDLKPLPDYLQVLPFFSTKIKLAKVTPESFTKNVNEYLEKLISDETKLILTYDRYFENVFLQEKGTGIYVNDFIENSKTKIQVTTSEEKDILQDNEIKYMKFSIGTVYKLAVLHVKDVEFEEFCSFWATDFSDPNFLHVNAELSDQIAKYCAETTTPFSPETQEMCLAQYEDNWYRALTLEAEGDDFLIFFLDFGNLSRLTSQSIRKIKREFTEVPVLAMNFTIKDADRLHKNPDLKKKVLAALEEKVNFSLNEVEICGYESDSYVVKIPEIEAIIEKSI